MINRLLLSLFFSLLFTFQPFHSTSRSKVDIGNYPDAHKIKFRENKGQVTDQFQQQRQDVLFSGTAGEVDFYLREDGISYQLYKTSNTPVEEIASRSFPIPEQFDSIHIFRLDLNWIAANSNIVAETTGPIDGVSNYYIDAQDQGIEGVHSYTRVRYNNVFQGVDVEWYEKNGNLEYDYILAPHADYTQIKWKVDGAEQITVDDEGNLLMITSFGTLIEQRPVAYQGGIKIPAEFTVENETIGFKIGNYDNSRELIIDPVVRSWGTYLGGTLGDRGYGIAVDEHSNIYICGITQSTSNIATSGSHLASLAGFADGYVAKFDKEGSRIWGTYFGGLNEDAATDCAISKDGLSIYTTGFTKSIAGIATTRSHQTTHANANNYDAFIVKFDSSGSRQWGSYYGGTGHDQANGCATDNGGNVYFSGWTGSSSAIASTSSHQSVMGGTSDAFLVKFSSSGSRVWGTYYGGTGNEGGNGCTVDKSNNVYLCGYTTSSTSIATSGVHQSSYGGGGDDAFLVKFNGSGSRQWSTYYGGSSGEFGMSCAVSDSMDVYLSGYTTSSGGISTQNANQLNLGGGTDGFLVKLSATGSRKWGTYYGGSNFDMVSNCFVDPFHNVAIIGTTSSSSSIASITSIQNGRGGLNDAFVAKFKPGGARTWSSYYGGGGADLGREVYVDTSNNLFFCGYAASSSKIASSNGHQSSKGGDLDGFLVCIDQCNGIGSEVYDTTCSFYVSPSGKFTWDSTGTYFDTLTAVENCDSVITVHLAFTQLNDSVENLGNGLLAQENNVSYQWIDCNDNNTAIPGAQSKLFVPTTHGSYAVVISNGNCKDTSDCVNYFDLGVNSRNFSPGFSIYPNPVKDRVIIELEREYVNIDLAIYAADGRQVQSGSFSEGKTFELELNLANGIYIVQLHSDNAFLGAKRLVVEQ